MVRGQSEDLTRNPVLMEEMLIEIQSFFGKMTVTKGDSHTYVGMNIRYDEKMKEQ